MTCGGDGDKGAVDAGAPDAPVSEAGAVEADAGAAGDVPQDPGDVGPPAPPPFSRPALLTAFGNCALSTAQGFLPAAAELVRATAAYEAAPDVTTRDAAQQAFRAAFDVWSVSEAMQFGPAAAKGGRPGGADYRDQIYLYPLATRCPVEEEIVAKGYAAPTFPTASLANRRGFYALEYLLFYEGADTACTAFSPIVASGSWAALSAEERGARKRAYATVLARDIELRASGLVDAWDPGKGNFLAALSSAGAGSKVFPTSQAAFNAVSDGVFYFEREMKDAKLARPLGLRECMTPSCPELIESPFAGRSKTAFAANLAGFRHLIEGCEIDYGGLGFDDLLASVGPNGVAVAAKMRQGIAATEAALAAIEEPDFTQALAQHPASLRALYDAVKALTDVLKTEFVTLLNLELPQGLEGDND